MFECALKNTNVNTLSRRSPALSVLLNLFRHNILFNTYCIKKHLKKSISVQIWRKRGVNGGGTLTVTSDNNDDIAAVIRILLLLALHNIQ